MEGAASVGFIGDSRQAKMFMRAVLSGSSSWGCCRFDGPEPRGDRSRSWEVRLNKPQSIVTSGSHPTGEDIPGDPWTPPQ